MSLFNMIDECFIDKNVDVPSNAGSQTTPPKLKEASCQTDEQMIDDESAAREEDLAAREKQLAAIEEQLAAREEQLAAREEQLAAREREVAAREKAREREAAAREQELAAREREAAAREEVTVREREAKTKATEKSDDFPKVSLSVRGLYWALAVLVTALVAIIVGFIVYSSTDHCIVSNTTTPVTTMNPDFAPNITGISDIDYEVTRFFLVFFKRFITDFFFIAQHFPINFS